MHSSLGQGAQLADLASIGWAGTGAFTADGSLVLAPVHREVVELGADDPVIGAQRFFNQPGDDPRRGAELDHPAGHNRSTSRHAQSLNREYQMTGSRVCRTSRPRGGLGPRLGAQQVARCPSCRFQP